MKRERIPLWLCMIGTVCVPIEAPCANDARNRVCAAWLRERAIRVDAEEITVRELRRADRGWIVDCGDRRIVKLFEARFGKLAPV